MNCVRNWWLSMVAKARYFWSENGPGNNSFWWHDVLLLIGGLQSELTLQWSCESYIRAFVTSLFFCQALFIFLLFCSTLQNNRDEVFKVVVEVLKFSVFIVAGCKLLLVKLHRKSITNIRSYIINGRISSGDDSYDSIELRKFKQRTMIMIRCIYGLIVVDIAFLSVPNEITDMVFEMRSNLIPSEANARSIFRLLFVTLFPLGILPKFFSSMATVGTLLLGMHTNFKILANRYRLILSQPMMTDWTDWRKLNRELKDTLSHHLEYCHHFKILKKLVGETFFLIHYYSIISIGALCYIIRDIGVNTLLYVVIATMAMFLLEYYMFCHFVDLFTDVSDRIGDHIFQTAILVPYNRKYHSQYVGFRTSLMIIWINTRREVSISCMSLFDISASAFLHVLNIAYTVLTFLIQMSDL